MDYRKISAIIRRDVLEKVEEKLQKTGVPGISVTKVMGYGEYADFYSRDWMVSHVQIEIFTTKSRADTLVQAIIETAHLGLKGDGIIAVLPVEQLYRIRTRTEVAIDKTSK